MNEKNREEQAAEARMAEMLSAALAEELGDMPKVSITVEELEALERADRQQRRKRRLRYFSMAAAVFFICVVALYALWPETAVPVSADKNTEQRVEEGNGVVVINEGDVEGSGQTSLREESWDEVLKYKDSLPELYIPGYVPKGYEFSYSELNEYSGSEYDIVYVYRKGNDDLSIKYKYFDTNSDKIGAIDDKDVDVENTNIGKVYISADQSGSLMSTMYLEEGALVIRGSVKKAEVIRIINKMQSPK